MTLKMLSQYYELRKKLMLYEVTLGSLRAAAESVTPKLSDMPKNPNVQDKLARFAVQIVDLEGQIKSLKMDVAAEHTAAMKYIESIQDGFIKTVFSLRFIECMAWADIAEAVGGNNTEDSVKKVCYRYLKTQKQSCPAVSLHVSRNE